MFHKFTHITGNDNCNHLEKILAIYTYAIIGVKH